MNVRDAMSTNVLVIGPHHTLREAAALMAGRGVGAAVVRDPDLDGVGIITERDVLISVGGGQNPDTERAEQHLTSDLVFAQPGWTLEQAAEAMVRGRFRHLVVLDGSEVAGILSVRDIVRNWTAQPAASGT